MALPADPEVVEGVLIEAEEPRLLNLVTPDGEGMDDVRIELRSRGRRTDVTLQNQYVNILGHQRRRAEMQRVVRVLSHSPQNADDRLLTLILARQTGGSWIH